MGYTTDFEGEFKLDRPLSPEHRAYLAAFNATRRMARNAAMTERMIDPLRSAVGLPVGPGGAYFVGAASSDYGQARTPDIVDYNGPPPGQPGLWCQWVPSDDGTAIVWDGGEKFYNYVEWLEYLLEHFLIPWGYALSGEVTYQGEESSDFGKIVVTETSVKNVRGKRTYEPAGNLRELIDDYIEKLGQLDEPTVKVSDVMDSLQEILYAVED